MESQLKLLDNIEKYAVDYNEEVQPDIMAAYSAHGDEVYKGGALSPKIKRLIALGVALRAGCTACILFQTKMAVEAGATKGEITEAVSVVVAVAGSTALGWSWRVGKLLEELDVH